MMDSQKASNSTDTQQASVLSEVIGKIVQACIRFPWVTILLFGLVAAGSGVYAVRNFAINTDISNLISPELDWRKREIAFEKAFPNRSETILAVVDAPTPELAGMAADALTEKLKSLTGVLNAVHRPDSGEFFQKNGLLFLPVEKVGETLGMLQQGGIGLGVLGQNPNWLGLSQMTQMALIGIRGGRMTLDSAAPTMNRFSDTFGEVLANHPASFSWQELMNNAKAQPSESRRYIEIWPKLDFSALEPGRQATDAVRKAAADLDIASNYQARLRLTGPVPIADEEFATVKEGALLHSIGTVVIVLIILWFALKSMRLIVSTFVALTAGLAITAALGFALVGSLNLISVAFFVLFVGLGVDFSIQYCVRYRDERYHGEGLKEALVDAGRSLGGPLTLAAAATAAGFFAFLPTDYQGVSELGLIAGIGMIIAYLMTITLLPAILAIVNPPGEKEPVGYAFLAPVDDFVHRYRVAIVAGTLGIAVLGAPLLFYLQFDFNPLNLRSSKVESISTYLDLRQDPNTGASSINILVPNAKEAQAVAEKLQALPEVSRVMTLESFVPDDQKAKLELIKQASESLSQYLAAKPGPNPTDAESIAAIKQTAEALNGIAEGQSGPGATAAQRLAKQLEALAAASSDKRAEAEKAVITPLIYKLAELRNLLQAQPVTMENLPEDLKRAWITPDGQSRVEVLPSGDPNDNDTLRVFAQKVLAIAPDAIGGPISILKSGDTIIVAFIEAGALALISISLLLWIALRRFSDVLLTVVPLLLAGVITMELCVLLNLPLNFANIIALPLLLGIGVAFKIYYIMAWRAGQTAPLQSSLTRAVFFSALTTGTAFGSLWMSSHPGTSSMGKLLALSLITTMLAAVLFQPALMGRPRNGTEPGANGGG